MITADLAWALGARFASHGGPRRLLRWCTWGGRTGTHTLGAEACWLGGRRRAHGGRCAPAAARVRRAPPSSGPRQSVALQTVRTHHGGGQLTEAPASVCSPRGAARRCGTQQWGHGRQASKRSAWQRRKCAWGWGERGWRKKKEKRNRKTEPASAGSATQPPARPWSQSGRSPRVAHALPPPPTDAAPTGRGHPVRAAGGTYKRGRAAGLAERARPQPRITRCCRRGHGRRGRRRRPRRRRPRAAR